MKLDDRARNIVLNEMRKDLLAAMSDFGVHGFTHTARWCCEMLLAMPKETLDSVNWPNVTTSSRVYKYFRVDERPEFPIYLIAKGLFDNGEFKHCVDYLVGCRAIINVRLRSYAQYLALYKDHCGDLAHLSQDSFTVRAKMSELEKEFDKLKGPWNYKTDAFLSFIRGMICVIYERKSKAIAHFETAVRKRPYFWAAWLELSNLASSVTEVAYVNRKQSHWMRDLFIAHSIIELGRPGEALLIYMRYKEFFPNSTYIDSQIALCYHVTQRFEKAKMIFSSLRIRDTYNIDFMDRYADLLAEQGSAFTRDIAILAEECNMISSWRRETFYVIGTYYSIKRDELRSLEYFHRATRVSPMYSRAWSRCGDKCCRSGNQNKSIYCYIRAIRINRRDFWSHVGLALSYHALHRRTDCYISYMLTAHSLRRYDWRVAITLGDYFYNVENFAIAIKYYVRGYDEDPSTNHIVYPRLAVTFWKTGDMKVGYIFFKKYLASYAAQPALLTYTMVCLTYGVRYARVTRQERERNFLLLMIENVKTAANGRHSIIIVNLLTALDFSVECCEALRIMDPSCNEFNFDKFLDSPFTFPLERIHRDSPYLQFNKYEQLVLCAEE